MDKKLKILFVISSYIQSGSSANIRNNALIEGLCDNGHIVDVLSREPDIEFGRCDLSMKLPPVRNFIYIIKKANEVNSRQNSISNENKKNKSKFFQIALKIYNSISIWDTWYFKVKRIKKIDLKDDYDLMISSSDPKSSHYLAKKIYKQNKSKIGRWIQYWGDPFVLDINQSAGSKARIKMVEKSLIKLADKVVYVSPFTLEKQMQIYKKYSNKMTFLPIPVRKKEITYNETTINSSLKLGYFGAYKKRDRDILPLYKAINNSKHTLEIIGPSDVILESTKNVIVHEQVRVPVSEVEKKEQEVDVLICICNRSGTQIPGKAYHYAMTNKIILLVLDGENASRIKEYFSKYNRYVFSDNNEKSILDALNNISNDSSLKTPCLSFSPQSIAKDFIM